MNEFEKYFPEDCALFYDLLDKYVKLKDEMHDEAYTLAQNALVLSARFNAIATDAGKLKATGNKTDAHKFFYGIYRTLQLMHEHARMVWNKGEKETRTPRRGQQ